MGAGLKISARLIGDKNKSPIPYEK
jgi:hypothetical protein